MFLSCCLLCLSSFLGVMSQTLTQSSSEIKKPGERVKMSCKGSGYTYTSYYIHWVQQVPGRGLTWIGRVHPTNNGDVKYSSSYQGRFTITTDGSITTSYLQIDNVKVEDTATYFCARDPIITTNSMDVWGPGTFVTVTSADQSAPSVFPMLPCDTLSSSTAVTIGCLSTGYLPAPVAVTWNSGSITTGIKNLPEILSNNGKFISSSLLTISVSDWKSKKYTCNVNHMGERIVNKTIPVLKSSQSTVEVLQSSCGLNGSVDLVCLISGYSSKDIDITWLQNEKAISVVPSNNNQYMDSQSKFIIRKLSVLKTDWDDGNIYTCKVTHRASSIITEKRMSKCVESSCIRPRIVLLPPSPKDLLITKEPKLTCVVSRLTSTETLNIKWKRGDNTNVQGVTSTPDQHFDGTYTVNSTLKISLSDWESKVSFTCNVEHSDLPSQVEKTIKNNREDQPREPTIYMFPQPVGNFKDDEFVGVVCLFEGFSHKDIYVEWKKNNISLGEDRYINTEPILTDDNETYIMFSRALVYKSEWNRGTTFSCSGGLRQISSKQLLTKNRGK